MNFDDKLAAYVLGRLLSSDLPTAAGLAVDEGLESEALCTLASSTPNDSSPRELEALLREAISECGMRFPSRRTAGLRYRNTLAAKTFNGELSPHEGARQIVDLGRDLETEFPNRAFVGDGLGIAEVVGAYYEFLEISESSATQVKTYHRRILAACRRIVES